MEPNLQFQSHISENTGEIEFVLQNFPGAKSYTDVYDRSKILTNKVKIFCLLLIYKVHEYDLGGRWNSVW